MRLIRQEMLKKAKRPRSKVSLAHPKTTTKNEFMAVNTLRARPEKSKVKLEMAQVELNQ